MKFEEKIFFVLCITARAADILPRTIIKILNEVIPHKRCWYYLEKWNRQGFYDYGVTLDLGWFYIDKLPTRYKELLLKGGAE